MQSEYDNDHRTAQSSAISLTGEKIAVGLQGAGVPAILRVYVESELLKKLKE